MKAINKYYLFRIFFPMLLVSMATAGVWAVPMQPLITSADQLSSNASVGDPSFSGYDEATLAGHGHMEALIDGRSDTFWHTDWIWNTNTPHYLQVRLNRQLEKEYIYVSVRRRIDNPNAHPTKFKIEGSANGSNWEEITHWEFAFQGEGSVEQSPAIYVPEAYWHLRFTVEGTNTDSRNNNGCLYMHMAEFQIYDCGYIDLMNDYGFQHTQGVLDERNRSDQGLAGWLDDWSKWGTGEFQDEKLAQASNVEMPNMSYFTSATDSRIKAGNRQATHVSEHTVYAIPGEIVTLYPYYHFDGTPNYCENFSRWYDYATDKTNPYLGFLLEPIASRVYRVGEHGYFGSADMKPVIPEAGTFIIASADDYKTFVNRVNDNGEGSLNAILACDIDLGGADMNPIAIWNQYSYTGTFDGNGHKIKNLKISYPDWAFVGMFGRLGNGAVIKNLILENANITGGNYVGGFAGGSINGETGTITLENLVFRGNVTAQKEGGCNGVNAGGIFGCNVGGYAKVIIRNCVVAGAIKGESESATISGWLGNYAVLENCFNLASLSGVSGSDYLYRCLVTDGVEQITLSNCWDVNEQYGTIVNKLNAADANTESFRRKMAIGVYNWMCTDDATGYGHIIPICTPLFGGQSWGKYASFYCPSDQDFTEEIIAADYGQMFNSSTNIDRNARVIYEPTIAFRHIFTVKNGKTFAENFSGSKEANDRFVKETRRTVSARAGHDFQIRMEYPMPVDRDMKSMLYYKAADGSYKHVCGYDVQTYNSATGEKVDGMFIIGDDEVLPSEGYGTISGNQVAWHDAGRELYRFVKCAAAKAAEGNYRVKLIAKDDNGNIINIAGTSSPLQVAEYVVTFLPESRASFVADKELASNEKYATHRMEYLKEKYGDPKGKIDFDEYRALENGDNENEFIHCMSGEGIETAWHAKMFKWPSSWEQSSYGFGYNNRFDYGMYNVANHCSAVAFKEAAMEFPAEENFGIAKGLYDRLFYDTKGEQQGYFYYVNASADPGQMASIDIDNLCPGSTLYVSAWVAEFSRDKEVANLILNFKAQLTEDAKNRFGVREVTLHSFVTGYVDEEPAGQRSDLGRWIHAYYSFVPNLSDAAITSADIEKFQLVLENNCISSKGADYAIDDIRVYVAKPIVYAEQTVPVCAGEKETTVKVEMPFDVLLSTLGVSEAATKEESKEINFFYTFLQKDIYEATLEETNDGTAAFDAAVLTYDYMGNGNLQSFGKLMFGSFFDESSKNYGIIGGERMLVLDTHPTDRNLYPGKEYIIALYSQENEGEGIVTVPTASNFDCESDCAKKCVFRVHSSGVVKIDGVVVPDLDAITCCKNQSPVVQVDLWGKSTVNGEIKELEKNAYFDWYNGPMDDFIEERMDDGHDLSDVMAAFRSEYPKAETWDYPAKGMYSDEMREYLHEMTTLNEETGICKLYLYQSSYVFPPTHVPSTSIEVECYAVAIPINREVDFPDYIICTDPSEIRIRVSNNSPEMLHGLGITYPNWMTDVPLRIGLSQLHEVSAKDEEGVIDTHKWLLNVPIRYVSIATKGVTSLKATQDLSVYLAETNDTDYKNLGVPPIEGEYVADPGLAAVGMLCEIVADKNGTGNIVRIVFHDNFNFKEGYYYRMKFHFEEDYGASGLPETAQSPCNGELVFTLKVVPEYQMWTGEAGNLNWNNDENWRRVSSKELYRTKVNANDEYVTDAYNASKVSYAPLDFTKVIIPAGMTYPHLYAVSTEPVTVTEDTETYQWPSTPSINTAGESPAGEATELIQYDMAAKTRSETDKNVGCRPWYVHTCKEIHFYPNAEIMGQQHLTYEKAHVEMEVMPQRWYTLASPLQLTMAGDMYLPTANAKQLTELFQPITFNTSDYNRFRPAVYQRAWNKASATVYEMPGAAEAQRNVAIKTTWSNVYNDVNEPYPAGAGFSIKTDVSYLGDTDETVLFRLPKHDKAYSYYSEDYDAANGTGVTGNNTTVRATEEAQKQAYKLNAAHGAITIAAAQKSNLFLVGNPFMAHLDMAKFLTENASKITPKYWVMTGDGQGAAIMTGNGLVGTLAEAGTLPPMQGFFVEAIEAAETLVLNYDESMMCVKPYTADLGNLLKKPALASGAKTRAATGQNALRIIAVTDGEEVSQSVIFIDPAASAGYDEREDAAMLDDPNQQQLARVYTIAGNMAACINMMPCIESTEVGVLAEAGQTTVLRFEGTDCVDGATLYDTATGKTTPLYDGMEYAVEGTAVGRLFITSEQHGLAAKGLQISVAQQTVTVTALDGCGFMAVDVYDMLGRKILSRSETSNKVEFTLDRGMFLVEAATDNGNRMHKKVIIR